MARERHWREECAIVGIHDHPKASQLTYMALYALQHRGQEGSGIVSADDGKLHVHRGPGLAVEVHGARALERLTGRSAIGHNRYSTTGASSRENLQPLHAATRLGPIAVAHNGNLVNALDLRSELEEEGAIFRTTTDTEVILHLVARSRKATLETALVEALGRLRGAFALVVLAADRVFAVKDPHGFRPLSLGYVAAEGDARAPMVASESCAFDIARGAWERELAPGEMAVLEGGGASGTPARVRSERPFPGAAPEPAPCIFEHIYFSRPDSIVFGQPVDAVRRSLGRVLAREHPADADIVISVPDSSNSAALGFAEESRIPFELGLIRNHYVGRTFIHPAQGQRDLAVRIKYNPVRSVLEGKRVVVVDDSIVRGTTSRRLIKMLREAGATEIHVRISSPPITHPCYYGVDTPSRDELIGATHTVEEIRKHLRVESLGYLSIDGMLAAAGGRPHCKACFDGAYLVGFSGEPGRGVLERPRSGPAEAVGGPRPGGAGRDASAEPPTPNETPASPAPAELSATR